MNDKSSPTAWTSVSNPATAMFGNNNGVNPLYRFYDKAIVKKKRISFQVNSLNTYGQWVAFWLPNTWRDHSLTSLAGLTFRQLIQFPNAKYGVIGNPQMTPGVHKFRFSSYPGKAQKMPDNSWTDYANDITNNGTNYVIDSDALYYNEFYFIMFNLTANTTSYQVVNVMQRTTVMFFERDDYQDELVGDPIGTQAIKAVQFAREHRDPAITMAKIEKHKHRHHHHHNKAEEIDIDTTPPATPTLGFQKIQL